MNILKTIPTIITFILLSALLQSCAGHLITKQAEPSEITGEYTLILYGARFSDDVEAVAILDKEGDGYTVEMFSSADNYTVQKGVQAKDAFEQAQGFVRFHRSFIRSKLSRIIDEQGNTIGYELRPLYHIADLGRSDVLNIYYRLKDDKVIVTIWPSQDMESRDPSPFGRTPGD